ncbi:hypothetical protein ACE2AJ_04390 [Aquihabitans daechungensis]|uniref:hypothetical protein n=1 Tax=Aquihabitans daechungensis TaxID=1052257 RepID=UPI003BA2565E
MVERIRQAFTGRAAAIGVLGAVLLLAGGSLYQSLITPPYRFIDEQAHAGYVLAIQDGRLPTIDTPIDQASAGPALRTRLAGEPERRRDVWVANNPPLTYLLASGPSAATRALGLPGGPLLGLRLVNIAAVAGAVVLSYLLGRDLAGGDRTVGLVAAGLVAAAPHLGFVASLGFNDGVAILTTTAVLLGLARVAGARPASISPEAAIRWLGVSCLLAALARPMSLVMAVVAAVLGLIVIWWRRTAPLGWSLAWLAGPSVVGAGWFYVLNVVRYGDPTGSQALFDKFLREPSGTLWSALTARGVWESALRTIWTRRLQAPLPDDPHSWYVAALWITVAGVVGVAVLVAWSALRNRNGTATPIGRLPSPVPLPGTAWMAVAVVALVPVLLTAQHRSGGGSSYPRYLLPMLPVVAAAIALTAVRFGTRWLGLALVALLAAGSFRQTRASARWLAGHPEGPPGSELVTAYGSELVRGSGLILAGVGLVLVLAAIARDPRQA